MDNRLLFTGPLQSYCLEDSHQAACMARVKARPPAQHVRWHKDKLKAGSTGAPSGALGKLCTQKGSSKQFYITPQGSKANRKQHWGEGKTHKTQAGKPKINSY